MSMTLQEFVLAQLAHYEALAKSFEDQSANRASEVVNEIMAGPPKVKTKAKPKATKANGATPPAPEPEPVSEFEPADAPTMEETLALAQRCINRGEVEELKAALKILGAARVSELDGIGRQAFVDYFAEQDAEESP